jgi:hypothetical protein
MKHFDPIMLAAAGKQFCRVSLGRELLNRDLTRPSRAEVRINSGLRATHMSNISIAAQLRN